MSTRRTAAAIIPGVAPLLLLVAVTFGGEAKPVIGQPTGLQAPAGEDQATGGVIPPGTYVYLAPNGSEVEVIYENTRNFARIESYDGVVDNGIAAVDGDAYFIYHQSSSVVVDRAGAQKDLAAAPAILDHVFLTALKQNRLATFGLEVTSSASVVSPEASARAADSLNMEILPVPSYLEVQTEDGLPEVWRVLHYEQSSTTPREYLDQLRQDGFVFSDLE